jgi:hypothetical protein
MAVEARGLIGHIPAKALLRTAFPVSVIAAAAWNPSNCPASGHSPIAPVSNAWSLLFGPQYNSERLRFNPSLRAEDNGGIG